MKKQVTVSIPSPCHENWDEMSTTEKGRFCGSCSKEVVDFSAMTDQQLFSYLKRSQGDLCGRFATDQLDRSIIEPPKPIKKTFWAILFSFILPFIAFNKAKAQKTKPPVEQRNKKVLMAGEIQLITEIKRPPQDTLKEDCGNKNKIQGGISASMGKPKVSVNTYKGKMKLREISKKKG